jgi:DNA-binding CsgD family transcriptional regulator/tetratricopeptide (TPR) repeat protein
VTALLEGLARTRPLAVVIEDLHWSDAATRDLLTLLTRNLRGRVLLLASMRTDEIARADPLHRFVGELERGSTVRVPLPPLDREEQARQVGAILGVPPRPSVIDDIFRRAEGNPLFAEELLAAEADVEGPPDGVRSLFLSRFDGLSPRCRSVLRAASAAGRRASYDLLATVCELDTVEFDEALREASDAHALSVSPTSDEIGFRHALLQEAIAGTLLPGERRRLHRRLAEALTARPELSRDGGHGRAERIAHHWEVAGDLPRTLVASLEAARAAERTLAFPAALANYERVIGLLDRVPDTDDLLDRPRFQILWFAAEAAHLAAFPERAAALVSEAISAVDLEDPHHPDVVLQYAYLHERLGRYRWMAADGEGALTAYERAVELMPTDRPTCWQAAVYGGMGQMQMLSGRSIEAIGWCEEAIRITGLVDDARSTEGHARNSLGVSLAAQGQLDEGIEHLLEARRIAEEEFDDVDDIARAIVNLHTVLLDAGRIEEAASVALDGLEIVRGLGLDRRKGIWCRCDAADALISLGRWAEAEQLTDEALSLDPAGVDAVRAHEVRGSLSVQRGELNEADRHLGEALRRAERVTDGQINGPLYAALVELATWRGHPSEAEELAEAGWGRLVHHGDPVLGVPLCAAAVRAAADAVARGRADRGGAAVTADLDGARRWLAAAEEAVSADPASKPEPRAHLITARAEFERATGTPDPDAWVAAAAAWDQLGAPHRVAYARWRGAESLLLSGGDRQRATELANEALTTADGLGATRLAAEVRALIRRARLCPSAPASSRRAGGQPPFQLTGREREVLELVASGRTDRQIAEVLFISHRTVERHVSNLLAKLGAATRSEATAIAHSHGLALPPPAAARA